MPLTELITLVHSSPGAFTSLGSFYRAWWTRQSSRSAYPCTFYADCLRPSVVYLVSGWHSERDYSRWCASTDRRTLLESHIGVVTITSAVLVNMDFDTIPRAPRGIVCIRVLTVESDDDGNEGGGDGEAWRFSDMESSLTVQWTGCGEDVLMPTTLYRFTIYDEAVTKEGILSRNRDQRDVVLMRRVSIPSSGT